MIAEQVQLPDLWPHQEDLRDRLRQSLAKNRSAIACAQTGFGKSRLAKWILGAYANRDKRDNESGNAAFMVHRRGLVDNASYSFNESPELPHGVIMSGVETFGGRTVQVASIDTALSWFCEGENYVSEQTYDLLIFDECHSHGSKFRTFLTTHNRKRYELGLADPFVLGLSATPMAKGLDDVYNEIVMGPSAAWLVQNRFLSPYRYFRATQGKLEKLILRGDEYTEKSVSSAMEGLSGDLVRDWKRFAEGRATVGFFPRLSHAKEAQEQLRAAGVRAEYVDGSTPDEERRSIFKQLDDGDIDYVCNVGVIERGTDIPRIGCVQLCTAIGSIARYRQMIGRGARMHPDKTDCIVLDHADNVNRHGFFEDDVHWTLDWTTRPAKDHEARPTIECPQCQAIYRGGKCRMCGYEPTRPERKKQGLDFDGAELTEIKANERKERKLKTSEQLFVDALFMCGRGGRTFNQALAIAYQKAEKQGTRFQVPSKFVVAGKVFRTIPRDSENKHRKIRETYPFTIGEYSAESNPYCVGEA